MGVRLAWPAPSGLAATLTLVEEAQSVEADDPVDGVQCQRHGVARQRGPQTEEVAESTTGNRAERDAGERAHDEERQHSAAEFFRDLWLQRRRRRNATEAVCGAHHREPDQPHVD